MVPSMREHHDASRRCRAATAGLALVPAMAMAAGAAPAAGDDGAAIDEVVVVAHRSERPLREIAGTVTIVTGSELRRDLATSLADAFRHVPGIDYESAGTRFGAEGLNVRGIGGNRIALLVDGVPLGRQFAVGGFSNATRDLLEAGLVQRIEVLHGPASALYGSDAIGGVVAVATPDPADIAGEAGFGGRVASTWHGADESLHGTGIVAAGDASRGALAGLSLRSGSAYDPAALPEALDRRRERRRAALLKLTAGDAFGLAWRAGLLHRDGEVATNLRSMLGTGRFAETTALEGDDESRLDVAWVEAGFGAPGGAIDSGLLRAWFAASKVDQRTLDVREAAARPVAVTRAFELAQRARGFELSAAKALRHGGMTQHLTAGIELRTTRSEESRDALEVDLENGATSTVLLGEAFPLRDFPISDTRVRGAWIEDTLALGNLRITAGLRADRHELVPRPDPVYAADNPGTVPVALSASDLSPKLGIVLGLSGRLEAYAQYAHGFRAPSCDEVNAGLDIPLFNVRAVPNPDLRSERSDGLEAGLRWAGERAALRIGLFHNRYRDFIESRVPVGIDPASGRLLFQSRNVSRARIEGLEAAWRVELPGVLEQWRIDGALYAARGEDRDGGAPLGSAGPAEAVLAVEWRPGDARFAWRLAATAVERAPRQDEAAGAGFRPPGHVRFDLFLRQELNDRATLRAGVLNLSDRTWWHWSAVRGVAPDDPVLGALAQPGRSVVAGFEWQWH